MKQKTRIKPEFFTDNLGVHCPEKWMSVKLFEELEKIGAKWCDGAPMKTSQTHWDRYRRNTVYYIEDKTYGTTEVFRRDYTIYHYYDAMEDEMVKEYEYKVHRNLNFGTLIDNSPCSRQFGKLCEWMLNEGVCIDKGTLLLNSAKEVNEKSIMWKFLEEVKNRPVWEDYLIMNNYISKVEKFKPFTVKINIDSKEEAWMLYHTLKAAEDGSFPDTEGTPPRWERRRISRKQFAIVNDQLEDEENGRKIT